MRSLLLVGVVSVGLGIAACGGEEEIDVVAAAAGQSAAAGPVKVRVTQSFDLPVEVPAGMDTGMDMNGVVDGDRSRWRTTLSEGDKDFTMEQITLGKVTYMRPPDIAEAQLPKGKKWIRMEMPDLPDELEKQTSLGFLWPMGNFDPVRFVEELRNSKDIEEAGDDEIDGRSTRRFRGRVDFGGERYPMQVWIDEQGLPRRQEVDMSFPEGKGKMVYRTDFLEYGVPGDFEPPPEGEVLDAEDTDFGSSVSGTITDSVHPEITVIR
jgi:hypothetical protein